MFVLSEEYYSCFDIVCGDFARAGRSHNHVGWAVSSREHLDESCYLHLDYYKPFQQK